MSKLDTIKSKVNELYKELYDLIKEVPHYYTQRFNELSKVCELQNQVASLSNHRIADALMHTIKQIAYASAKPNHEVICEYLEKAIEDLKSGMDSIQVLYKYHKIHESIMRNIT